MTPRARLLVAFATTCAVAACPVVIGGCASKPPQPEATPPAAPESSKPGKDATTAATPGAVSKDSRASADATVPDAAAPVGGASTTPDAAVAARDQGVRAGGTATNQGARPDAATSVASGSTAPAAANPTAATRPTVRAARRSAQTPDERRAALDKRLNDSLGVFDAKLREEQQKIARDRDARQASVVTVPAADSGGSNDGGLNRDRSIGGHDSRDKRDSGGLKSDKAANAANGTATGNAGNGIVANEIPDGSDDDVVARRIRKAAEQETDPELKDKLWKEYVEYKKNTHAR